MQRHGRISQILLELTLALGIGLIVTVLAPWSSWQTLGQTGASIAGLVYAAVVSAFVALRPRPLRLPSRKRSAALIQAAQTTA
jgi:hypothetical protein